MIGTPFNNEAPLLNEWLVILESEGVNPSDGGLGHGQLRPGVSGDTGAGREGHKVIIALCVSRGTEGDGSERASTRGVGRGIIFENLDVRSKFESHGVKIGLRSARNEGIGTHVVGNAVLPGKLVEAPNRLVNHMSN